MAFIKNNNKVGLNFLVVGTLVWWSGVAGRDLYMVMVFIGLLIMLFKVSDLKNFKDVFGSFISDREQISPRTLIYLLIFHGVLLAMTVIFNHYSFQWNIWDVGIHSNILFNISNREFYSSYYQSHNWGDHFTPSMSFISLLYSLYPSTNWMTLSKVIAYIISPLIIWEICRNIFQNKIHAYYFGIAISLFWLFFYAPIVNSLYSSFHPTALAAPAIFYAFLCLIKKTWWRFAFTLLFLIGLKEHMGAVWIGFGLYMIINTSHKKSGTFLVILGVLIIFLVMWVVMPFYRNYEPAWTTGSSENISLFEDIPGKLLYLTKIFLPLGFLPLIFWKYGIFAGPAVGVNLLASYKGIYSTIYHYDDLTAPLLFITTILCLKQIISSDILKRYIKKIMFRRVFLFWVGIVFILLPASPMRIFWKSIPSSTDWEILEELRRFDKMSKSKRIAVQSSIGPYFQRKKLQWYIRSKGQRCEMKSHIYSIRSIPVDYVVLIPRKGHYGIDNLELCLEELYNIPKVLRVTEFKHLEVFKRID